MSRNVLNPMDRIKAKARRIETEEQRAERLSALDARDKHERRAQDDALDAMVRRSIALHGA